MKAAFDAAASYIANELPKRPDELVAAGELAGAEDDADEVVGAVRSADAAGGNEAASE